MHQWALWANAFSENNTLEGYVGMGAWVWPWMQIRVTNPIIVILYICSGPTLICNSTKPMITINV